MITDLVFTVSDIHVDTAYYEARGLFDVQMCCLSYRCVPVWAMHHVKVRLVPQS